MKTGCHPTDQNAVGVSLVAGVREHDRGRVLLVPNVPDRPSRWRGGAADWQKANGGGPGPPAFHSLIAACSIIRCALGTVFWYLVSFPRPIADAG